MEVEHIEIRNAQYADISNRKVQTETNLSSDKLRLAELEVNVKTAAKTLDVFSQKMSSMIALFTEYTEDVQENVLAHLTTAKRYMKDTVDANREDIGYFKRRIDNALSSLAQYEEQLTSMSSNPFRTIEKITILSKISKLKEYIPYSLKLLQEAEPKIIWEFSNIFMRPTPIGWTGNDSLSIDTPEHAPYIPIGNTQIIVNLTREMVLIKSAENNPHAIYGWTGHTPPHPHVLDGCLPCFGDFEPAIVSAIRSMDWLTLAVLVREFLQHANSEDSAGRKWRNFFTAYFTSNTHIIEESPGVFYGIVNGEKVVHPLSKAFVLDRSS